jgi:murein DD-endopeptidase MepM/ murein hydrolase activator NlpD
VVAGNGREWHHLALMRRGTLAVLLVSSLSSWASPETVSRTVGQVTMSADLAQAFPGGVAVVQLRSRRGLGAVDVLFDGRRAPVYNSARGPWALVPIPVGTPPGQATLGFEIMARTGRQRVPIDITISPRDYGSRTVAIPETRRYLASQPSATRNSRQLLALLRTESPAALWRAPFGAPVAAAPVADSFGAAQTYTGAGPGVEYATDATFGEYHRGLDYEVPAGTVVQAPAAATVLFAGYMSVPGNVVVLDHGQGIVSVLCHLTRVEVREGDVLEARAPVGTSGDTGLSRGALLEWRLYVHGLAVDPRVMASLRLEQ